MTVDDNRSGTVRAVSADKAVRGSMSPDAEVTIDLDAALVSRLSAADLGSAVTSVVHGLVQGLRRSSAPPVTDAAEPEATRHTAAGRMLDAYYRELAAVEVEVVSPRGLVKAAWAQERPTVRVRPGSPLPATWTLTGEINAAVASMFATHSRRCRQIFRRHVSLRRLEEES